MRAEALLVIDMQAWFFHQERPVHMEDELLANVNRLIDAFHASSRPVLFIRHTNDSYLREDTDDWALHRGLHTGKGDLILDKRVRNAFGEPAIRSALDSMRVGSVVIAGMVTHGCVRAACEGALELGYAVTLAADAHSSFDENAAGLIGEWNGTLSGNGATIADTAQIVGGGYPARLSYA